MDWETLLLTIIWEIKTWTTINSVEWKVHAALKKITNFFTKLLSTVRIYKSIYMLKHKQLKINRHVQVICKIKSHGALCGLCVSMNI